MDNLTIPPGGTAVKPNIPAIRLSSANVLVGNSVSPLISPIAFIR